MRSVATLGWMFGGSTEEGEVTLAEVTLGEVTLAVKMQLDSRLVPEAWPWAGDGDASSSSSGVSSTDSGSLAPTRLPPPTSPTAMLQPRPPRRVPTISFLRVCSAGS